ncbi:MAG: methionine synthase [Actinomycetes bacterium]
MSTTDRPTPEVPSADGPPPTPVFPARARGVASGVGSLPGTDPRQAARTVAGELPDLPHLPELPARGAGADLVGRTAALLPDMPVDLQPSGWRLTARSGIDGRRASSYLSHDLDAFQEALDGHDGAAKVAVAGPWTLAAALQLPRGEPVLSDRGATRDLLQALTQGVVEHVAEVQRRLPGCEVVLQLDEPGLGSVLLGRVPSFSGVATVRAVAENDAVAGLADLVRAVGSLGVPVVAHSCAADAPLGLFLRAGVVGLSVDLTLVGQHLDEPLGEALESGSVLLAGTVPAVDAPLSDPATTVGPVRRLWSRLGLSPETMASSVVMTPTCGMAGASPGHAVRAMRLAREAARVLADG